MSNITLTEDFFDYDGYPIQFLGLQSKESKKDFIFVNGIADPVQNHTDIFEELVKRGYRVWALNMPGHGKSGKVENVNWGTLVEIVRTFVEGMGVKEHVIGGFSMGGGVAIMYAGMYPDNILAIRALSPFCYGLPSISGALIGGAKFTFDFLRNRLKNPTNKPAPSNEIYPWYYIPHYTSVIMRGIEIDPKALRDIPIDIVVGAEDEVIKYELIKESLRGLHNAKFRIVEGLGHDIYFIEEKMIEQIAEYLVK